MRTLAADLETAPMSLYRHVSSRDDLIDGMVDIVFGEIDLPGSTGDWRSAMRRRALSARRRALPPSMGHRPGGVAGTIPVRRTSATTTP